MYRIMIVEDDKTIVEVLKRQLEQWNYQVTSVKNFDQVMEEFTAADPHLVLMDIYLPFYNGYYWCSEIRKVSNVPVVFLSSAGDDMNLVMAVNLGADDFLTKPFRMEVVLAKIQALLRRTYDFGTDPQTLVCSGITLNLSEGTVSYGQEKLSLTRNELKILELLMENKGEIVSRDELIEALWQTEDFIDDNTLTVNVARLRKKLEKIGLKDVIQTRKSQGYLLRILP